MGLRLLKICAWAIFGVNALLMLVVVIAGLATSSPHDADMTLVPVMLGAVPLAVLFALVFFGSRRDGRVRLWFGVVLGAIPLFLLIEMIGEQRGLWPRM